MNFRRDILLLSEQYQCIYGDNVKDVIEDLHWPASRTSFYTVLPGHLIKDVDTKLCFVVELYGLGRFLLVGRIYGVILRAAGSRLVAVKMTAGRPSRHCNDSSLKLQIALVCIPSVTSKSQKKIHGLPRCGSVIVVCGQNDRCRPLT